MSSFNAGRGSNRVPQAPTAQNHQLQNRNPFTALIKSVSWEQSQGSDGATASFQIALNKMPMIKLASIEILYGSAFQPATVIDRPAAIPVTGQVTRGSWKIRLPQNADRSQGKFTIRVRIENDSVVSNALLLSEHPAARAVRINNTDGFDR